MQKTICYILLSWCPLLRWVGPYECATYYSEFQCGYGRSYTARYCFKICAQSEKRTPYLVAVEQTVAHCMLNDDDNLYALHCSENEKYYLAFRRCESLTTSFHTMDSERTPKIYAAIIMIIITNMWSNNNNNNNCVVGIKFNAPICTNFSGTQCRSALTESGFQTHFARMYEMNR